MQTHHIRLDEQRVQPFHLAGIAQRQARLRVMIDHPHAHRFGEHRELAANIAVADDPQRLAANLDGIGSRFVPHAAMRIDRLRDDAAHQHDDLTNHQLGHRAGVAVGRVEHRNAKRARRFQLHLVGTDAEAAHRHQPVCSLQHLGAQLGAAAYTQDMGAAQRLHQFIAVERLGMTDDVAVAVGLHHRHRRVMDPLQKHHFDTIAAEGEAGKRVRHQCSLGLKDGHVF